MSLCIIFDFNNDWLIQSLQRLRFPQLRTNLSDEIIVIRKNAGLILRVNEINGNVKDAPGSTNQLGVDIQHVFDSSSQPGRDRAVVSGLTVCDRYVHSEIS